MFEKLKLWFRKVRLSLWMKVILAFSAIAVVLLMSSVISVLEYRHMSNYVSGLIADNVKDIHLTQDLMDAVDGYNLQLLAVIDDDNLSAVPSFDNDGFLEKCNQLKENLGERPSAALADSVLTAYSAYRLASGKMGRVFANNYSNNRDWYFGRLQPRFIRLRSSLEKLSSALYGELDENSQNFENGFFRSIIPSTVAITVGILLLFLLLFYILVYYVKPIYKMRDGLQDYLSYRRRYNYTFDSNDQLGELNHAVTELMEDNRNLRKRIADLKDKQ